MLARMRRILTVLLLGTLFVGSLIFPTCMIYNETTDALSQREIPHWFVAFVDLIIASFYALPLFMVKYFTTNWREGRRRRRKPREAEGVITAVTKDDQMIFPSAEGLINAWEVTGEWTHRDTRKGFRFHEGTYWTKPTDIIGRKIKIIYEDGCPSNYQADLSFLEPFEKLPPARPIHWWEYLPSVAMALLSVAMLAYAVVGMVDGGEVPGGRPWQRLLFVPFLLFFGFLMLPDREPIYGRE